MKFFDNLFNFNIQRLFLQGKIEVAYERMYNTARRLAAKEILDDLETINIKLGKNDSIQGSGYWEKLLEKIANIKKKRIEHHMGQMKELLKLREQLKEDKK